MRHSIWRVAGAAVLCAIHLWAASAAHAEWGTYQGDASHDGYVPVTVDALNLSQEWITKLPTGTLTDMAVGGGGVYVSSCLYYKGSTPTFFALDEGTGAVKWQKNFGNVFSTNTPAYCNGIVYVQTGSGISSPPPYLHAINASTGASVFNAQFDAQAERYLSPTPYGGNVYVDGGTYGGIYSFNGSSGKQNWFGYVEQNDSGPGRR